MHAAASDSHCNLQPHAEREEQHAGKDEIERGPLYLVGEAHSDGGQQQQRQRRAPPGDAPAVEEV